MTTQAELIALARQRQQEKQNSAPTSAKSNTELLNTGETIWGTVLGSLVGFSVALAGIAVAAGVIGIDAETKSYWYLSRASGIVAYLLLWASVAWGLLLSTRLGRHLVSAPVLLDAHQFVSNVGLGFAFFHGLILMGDQYLSFPLSAVLVPFAGEYEPLLVAAGQIGLWLSLLLIVSFYVRRWIGAKAWRLIHYLSFIGYWLVLIHAVWLGSDTAAPAVAAGYLVSGALVIFLTIYRVLSIERG
jgi:predicted ferric reductase